jgi:lipoprotein NlpD
MISAQRLWIALTLAIASIALASCGSTPTAAPVLERSPNAGPAAKPSAKPPAANVAVTPAAPTSPPAASTAPANTTSPNAASTSAAPVTKPLPSATSSAPAPLPPVPVTPAKTDKQPNAASEKSVATEEPTTKPYREGDWRPEYHIVKKGDTLYSIALDYGQDYREIAAWNNLDDPGLIKIDQRLRLFPPDSVGEATSVQATPLPAPAAVPSISEPKARKVPYSEQALAQFKMPMPAATASPTPANVVTTGKPSPKPQVAEAPTASAPKETVADGKMIWEWPAQGKLLYGFGQGPIPKGIGIEGHSGQPVLAAAPGKVVYSGSGLRGYGKLIIVKHNTSYLSVYAHNSRVLVKEGQTVAKGQKIAEVGDTDSDRLVLHFEIRRLGKPIDPLQYLPERS